MKLFYMIYENSKHPVLHFRMSGLGLPWHTFMSCLKIRLQRLLLNRIDISNWFKSKLPFYNVLFSLRSVVVKTKPNKTKQKRVLKIICVSKADKAGISFKDKSVHILQLRFPKIHGEAEFLPCEKLQISSYVKIGIFRPYYLLPSGRCHIAVNTAVICHGSWHALLEACKETGLGHYLSADLTIRRILHFNKTLKTSLVNMKTECRSLWLWALCGMPQGARWVLSGIL